MTLVLLSEPTLEFVSRHHVDGDRPPGVVILPVPDEAACKNLERVFVFAYRENPDTFVYRESVAMYL